MANKTYICDHTGTTNILVGKNAGGKPVYKTLSYKKGKPFEADEKHVAHLGKHVKEVSAKEAKEAEQTTKKAKK